MLHNVMSAWQKVEYYRKIDEFWTTLYITLHNDEERKVRFLHVTIPSGWRGRAAGEGKTTEVDEAVFREEMRVSGGAIRVMPSAPVF